MERGSYLRIRRSGLRFEDSEVKLNSTESATRCRKVERSLCPNLDLDLEPGVLALIPKIGKYHLYHYPLVGIDEVRDSSNSTGFIIQV